MATRNKRRTCPVTVLVCVMFTMSTSYFVWQYSPCTEYVHMFHHVSAVNACLLK